MQVLRSTHIVACHCVIQTLTISNGLCDEEKKKTSDNFELHLELADLSNIAAVLIPFFSSQNVGVHHRALQQPRSKWNLTTEIVLTAPPSPLLVILFVIATSLHQLKLDMHSNIVLAWYHRD
jgi:hypothetical protein